MAAQPPVCDETVGVQANLELPMSPKRNYEYLAIAAAMESMTWEERHDWFDRLYR
jgi:hypothetical protein